MSRTLAIVTLLLALAAVPAAGGEGSVPAGGEGVAAAEGRGSAPADGRGDDSAPPSITVTASSGPVSGVLTADPSVLRVGERVRIEIALTASEGAEIAEPPEEIPPLHVVARSSEEPREAETVRWAFEAAPFELGELEVASFPVAYRTAAGETGVLELGPVRLEVVPTVAEDDEELADIRGPVSFPLPWLRPLLWAAAALLAAALVALLVRWALRRRRARALEAAVPPPPHEVALERLRRLDAGGVPRDPEELKGFYVEMSEAVREYLEGRFGVEALERTTEEVSFLMRRARVRLALTDRVVRWLEGTDLVKFARHVPPEETTRDALREGVRFVQETKIELVAPEAAAAGGRAG
jgi:hypothetical protein